MKFLITALVLVFSLSTNAELAPKIKCVATIKGPNVDVTKKLTYHDGGAAINEHFLAQTEDFIFVGFFGVITSSTTAYQGMPMTLAIFSTNLNKTLVEKKVVLYSNTLDYTVTATTDDVTATLTCVRFQ